MVLYCVTTLLIKVALKKFSMDGFEMTYQFSAPLVLVSYIGMKKSNPKEKDWLEIPRDMFWPLMGRCILGFLNDVTMFMSFMYTAYSKAFCIRMMGPFLSPFVAFYMLHEAVKYADIIGVILGFVGMVVIL